MIREELKQIIIDQKAYVWHKTYVRRHIPDGLVASPEIIVISGVRRCGKSTLLQQIRHVSGEKDYFMNFDDERLVNFKVDDFQLLFETFMEMFGEQSVFWFDEIQNVTGWERFVRRLYDLGKKVYITGSNARMLSRELGTHLTGRYIRVELYPFSFGEFLEYRRKMGLTENDPSSAVKSEILQLFNEFSVNGGFPGYLNSLQPEYLKSLFESILYRDVMVRNNLTGERELLELIYYVASNVSKLSSNNGLAAMVGVKNATTIKNYFEFLQNAYLLFQVRKYDYSLAKQIRNPRKTYFIDQALIRRLGFIFSDESGRILENIVFIELKRNGREVFYHTGNGECDFVVREGPKVTEAIQVCYTFQSNETKERELRGLTEAMDTYDLNEGLIITHSLEEQFAVDGKKIQVLPAWKWMLGAVASHRS